MPFVITLTGPSRCGKSEVIKIMKKISLEQSYYANFKPILIRKYTTRNFRTNELDLIKNGNEKELDIKAVINHDNFVKGLSTKELEEKKLKAFNKIGCDLVYEQYGCRYGLKLSEIYDCLKNGLSPIVILNDIRTVEDVKCVLGNQCKALFIFREVPNMEHFLKHGRERNESLETIQTRFDKAVAIYRIYIENIHIFDKCILNISHGHESLERMLRQFIEVLCEEPMAFK